jgi:hypothetical protein
MYPLEVLCTDGPKNRINYKTSDMKRNSLREQPRESVTHLIDL